MPAQPRRLVVPAFELSGARGLRLTERIAEVVKEVVRIAGRQSAHELVAIPDERRLAAPGIALEHNIAQRETFGQPAGRRGRADGNLHDDGRLRRQRRAGHFAGNGVGPRLQHLAVVGRRRPGHANVRTAFVAAVVRGDFDRKPREESNQGLDSDVWHVRDRRGKRRFEGNTGRRNLRLGDARSRRRSRRQRIAANGGDLLFGQCDAIQPQIAESRMDRRSPIVLRASDEQPVRITIRLVDDLRRVDADVCRLAGASAIEIRRHQFRGRVEDDCDVQPAILQVRHGGRFADGSIQRDQSPEARLIRDRAEPGRRPLPEVEDRPRGACGQIQPCHDAEGVFTGHCVAR